MVALSGSIDFPTQGDVNKPDAVDPASYALVIPPVFALPYGAPNYYKVLPDEVKPPFVTPPPMLTPVPGFPLPGSLILPLTEPLGTSISEPPTTGQLWPRGGVDFQPTSGAPVVVTTSGTHQFLLLGS